MRIKLVINYIGTGFIGWQHQKGGGSVQDEIETAVFRLTGERVSVQGSGRTDTGVHALGQVAHFDLNKEFETGRIAAGLNFYLPKTVRISSSEPVNCDFHARKSAKKKTYIYLMYKSYFDNVLLEGRALKIPNEADVEQMKKAARHFAGTHDFYAFMSAGSSARTSVRTVFDSEIILLNSGSGFELFSTPSLHFTSQRGECGSRLNELDVDLEKECKRSSILGGESSKNKDSGSTLDSCSLFSPVPPLIIYKVTADGFLYNMVRKITACILQTGLGKIDENDIPSLITAKDRTLTKDTAKPHGLYLYSVEY